MTARTVTNVPASVQARLLKIAHVDGIDFQLLLNRYVIERFLYRLSQSTERDSFVLKGAMLFALWVPRLYRTTRDLDLLGRGSDDVQDMVGRMAGICRTPVVEDGILFASDAIEGERILAEDEYLSVRIHVPAAIGKARTRMQIDVGLGDAAPGAHAAEYPTYLDFPAPRLRVYSKEASIAEKFEALVVLGMTNSRMKDFFDIRVLPREFAFEGTTLADAISQTFARRRTPIPAKPPAGLSREFAVAEAQQQRWGGFLRRAGIPPPHERFESVVGSIAGFLMPVSAALAAKRAVPTAWSPGGPWTAAGGR